MVSTLVQRASQDGVYQHKICDQANTVVSQECLEDHVLSLAWSKQGHQHALELLRFVQRRRYTITAVLELTLDVIHDLDHPEHVRVLQLNPPNY